MTAIDRMTFCHLRIVVLGVFLIAACSATGPVYQAAPTQEEASVLVYVFRPSRFAMGPRTPTSLSMASRSQA